MGGTEERKEKGGWVREREVNVLQKNNELRWKTRWERGREWRKEDGRKWI